MKKTCIFIFCIFAQLSRSQSVRNYSNEFLNIGVDAAALGMSKSVTATASDVNAIYWNPAGLAAIQVNQVSLMHQSHFAGMGNFDHAALALVPKEAKGTVMAFSLVRFGVDNIQNTTNLVDSLSSNVIDFDRISLFSAVDYAFNVGLGYRFKRTKNLRVGLNAKIIRRNIGDFASSWGFGLDLGMQYKVRSWKFGWMLRDFTTTTNVWTFDEDNLDKIRAIDENTNQETPEKTEFTLPKLHVGIAKSSVLKNKKFHLLTEVDMHVRFAETNDLIASKSISMTPSMGLQLDYGQFVFLRFGVGNFQKITNFDNTSDLSLEPNVGLGFKVHGISVDYALSNIASSGNTLYSNTFSLKIEVDFIKRIKKAY